MALSTTGMLMLRTGPVHVIPSLSSSSSTKLRAPPSTMVVECSSRPQKKATAHHMKTRPKKTQPWDVKRKGPTAYAPLPTLPPDWTLVSSEEPPLTEAAEEAEAVAVTAAP